MNYSDTHSISLLRVVKAKVADYCALVKMRLTSLVVFSAVLGYFIAAPGIHVPSLLAVIFGGFLVTGASNSFNQILEKDTDKLMSRTKNRPLPRGSMSVAEAMTAALVMSAAGISILWFFLNPLSGLLGTMALIMYAGVYTPMKRKSSLAVFVGAFPGAIPPMLGYVAETGKFGLFAGLLFAIQFVWQFPHFWAIAWKMHDDYKKAGMHLLPSSGGKNMSSAVQMLLYTLFLIPISLTPYYFGFTGVISAVVILFTGLGFAYYAYDLVAKRSDRAALKLMFASFIYLPVVQVALWLDCV